MPAMRERVFHSRKQLGESVHAQLHELRPSAAYLRKRAGGPPRFEVGEAMIVGDLRRVRFADQIHLIVPHNDTFDRRF